MRLVKEARDHFVHDWNNRRWLFWLEMIATICSFIGATLVAVHQSETNFAVVYTIFLIASSAGIISGNARESAWLVITSTVFTVVNTIGIIKALM